MKPAIKRKWVKALLSGEYKQGDCALKFGDRFCCLGVLRHCADPDDERGSHGYLSPEQLKEFGLTEKIQDCLVNLNDFEIDSRWAGVPFEMIAGLIDEAL